MKRSTLMRFVALVSTAGTVFSQTGSTCSQFVNSLFGALTSPGAGGQDTDGDGFTDARELSGGSDAFDPASTPDNP